MAYVIAAPCGGCKDRGCVSVCPCDCIQEGDVQLFIDPDVCIDCGLCEPECPVDAIYADDELPSQWTQFIDLNARFFARKAIRPANGKESGGGMVYNPL